MLHRAYGDVVRTGIGGPLTYYLVFHPAGVEQVLAHSHKNFRKGLVDAQFRVLDGNGLVTSEGGFWGRQRRLAQPAFHRPRLEGLIGIVSSVAARLAERFAPSRFLGEPNAHRARYAYFPFGGGPRKCLGLQFAVMEAQIMLATLVQRFEIALANRGARGGRHSSPSGPNEVC